MKDLLGGTVTRRRAYCGTHGWVHPYHLFGAYSCPKCHRRLNDSEWSLTAKQRAKGLRPTLTGK